MIRLSKKHHPGPPQIDKFLAGIAAKQQNTTWPGPLRNSRGIDVFLWRGSSDPTPVQRIGAWLIGISMYLIGIVTASVMIPARDWMGTAFAAGMTLVGIKIFLNGFPKAAEPGTPRRK
jgi:hypothetical protein